MLDLDHDYGFDARTQKEVSMDIPLFGEPTLVDEHAPTAMGELSEQTTAVVEATLVDIYPPTAVSEHRLRDAVDEVTTRVIRKPVAIR